MATIVVGFHFFLTTPVLTGHLLK